MKSLRPVLLAIVLAGAFYYLSNVRRPAPAPVTAESAGWSAGSSKLEITEAAAPQSFDAEEQNNINVYRKVLPAVVNITSKAVASTSSTARCRSRARAREIGREHV